MDKQAHLPMYGVGPKFVFAIIAVTAAAVAPGHYIPFFECGMIKELKAPSAVIGILLIVLC